MPKKGTPQYDAWVEKYRRKRSAGQSDNKFSADEKQGWLVKFNEAKDKRKLLINEARNLEVDLSLPIASLECVTRFYDLTDQAMFYANAFRSGLNWEYMQYRYHPKKLAQEEFPVHITRQIWKDLKDAYLYCRDNNLLPQPY